MRWHTWHSIIFICLFCMPMHNLAAESLLPTSYPLPRIVLTGYSIFTPQAMHPTNTTRQLLHNIMKQTTLPIQFANIDFTQTITPYAESGLVNANKKDRAPYVTTLPPNPPVAGIGAGLNYMFNQHLSVSVGYRYDCFNETTMLSCEKKFLR